MANIGIKEKKAWGYFSFIQEHKFSDVAYVELQASRDTDLDEADTLMEYGVIDEDAYFYENYKPEMVLDAIKKAIELINKNWKEVELVFHLEDKETKSRSYFSLTVCSYLGNKKEVSFGIGATIKKKERDSCEKVG